MKRELRAAPPIPVSLGGMIRNGWTLARAGHAERVCARDGHRWFPDAERREFLPVRTECLRCRAVRVELPFGQCLGGHPLAEHYTAAGAPVDVAGCAGPR